MSYFEYKNGYFCKCPPGYEGNGFNQGWLIHWGGYGTGCIGNSSKSVPTRDIIHVQTHTNAYFMGL